MITLRDVEILEAYDPGEALVASLYLSVDPDRVTPAQYKDRALEMIHDTRLRLASEDLTPEQRACARMTLDRIARHVCGQYGTCGARGLVVFACASRGLWRTLCLPASVPDRLVLRQGAWTEPLRALLHNFGRFLAVIVGSGKSRICLFELGEIVWSAGISQEPAASGEDAGERALRHFLKTADALADVVEREHPERVLVGGTTDAAAAFLRTLPGAVRNLVVDRLAVSPQSGDADLKAAAARCIAGIEHSAEEAWVRRVRSECRQDGHAVLGLEPTLHALSRRAIQTLVVDRKLWAGGHVCADCGRLYTGVRVCPECGAGRARGVEDVVAAAVTETLRCHGDVKFVSDLPDWAGDGGIGAILRFRLPKDATR